MIGLLSALFLILTTFSWNTWSAPKIATQANPNAPKGGTFNFNLGSEPATLHPITSTDGASRAVRNYTCDRLAYRDLADWSWKPALAEKWEVSKDGKEFLFDLRQEAQFHDGKTLTAEDVKFSFDAIFEPKYNAAHIRPYYENIDSVEVLNPHKIRVKVKNVYFGNFDVMADLQVIPKHIYSDVEASKKMNRKIVCSGPYTLEKFEKGQSLVLKKNPSWWGNKAPFFKGYFNFDTINMKFILDGDIAIEHLKKGTLDLVPLSTEDYLQKTHDPAWGKSIFKVAAENDAPRGYDFIGWNLERGLFQDRNVRLALSYLFDREGMNKKFNEGQNTYVSSPTYRHSEYAPDIKPLLFDSKKAKDLLKKAGWSDSDKDGVLDHVRDGKKEDFHFTLTLPNKNMEKFMTWYQKDLRDHGIIMEIKILEWSSFLKLLDDGNFDAVWLVWSASDVDPDLKQIWHSSSAVKGGSNFIHYKSQTVDELIDSSRKELNRKERIKKVKEAYRLIAEDAPYLFLFSTNKVYYGYNPTIGRPGDVFKFGAGRDTWWKELSK